MKSKKMSENLPSTLKIVLFTASFFFGEVNVVEKNTPDGMNNEVNHEFTVQMHFLHHNVY